MLAHEDPSTIFRSNFLRTSPPCLGLGDYPHLAADLQILAGYLRRAMAKRQAGVNVLFHGAPGTGKTELAKALAEHLGTPLFEIAVDDRYGAVHRGEARFGAFQLAQGVLGGEPSPLILFDEIEDAFPRASDEQDNSRGSRNGSGRKGWINRLLQENRVPAFWITNTRMVLDPAYLRRFDYVLEVGVPPRSVRAKVLDRYLSDLPVTSQWKAMIAEHDGLTPAGIERAAKVARIVLETRPGMDADAVVDRVLGNSLEALGSPRHPRTMPPSATTYRLDVLNTDRDLGLVCDGLKRTGSGRLCLYGPPGSGKTAFGHHLAQVLDRPLLLRRASDLQSKWVGETEQNMARMFQDADADNAVLLLDEADSFLQDRRGAERSWEISQVNEMLTQMETFQGVFIANTNLMESLDQASLRRFDIKVKFGYLGRDQIVTMFRDSVELLGLQPDPSAERRVGMLANLTPGDFAAALRQARLVGNPSALEFADMLVRECAIKVGGLRRGIGF
jgi:SpoVK/Ycf46/Vps4 family AAA+-type ATPase